MGNVSVTNRGKEPFSRRWDGKPYDFPPGEEVTIPEDAAAFIFAYGLDENSRARTMVRNGWQRNNIRGDDFGPEAAAKRLKSFVFKAAPDDPKREAPEKKRLPQHREPTGVAAMTPGLEKDDRKISARPAQPVMLPGSRAPLAPPAP